jgi:hypothetical protein
MTIDRPVPGYSNGGMSVKDLVLRLDGKLDAFILAHEARHQGDQLADAAARSEASGTPAGRALAADIKELRETVETLAVTVGSHDRTQQRLIGAMAFISLLGLGTIISVVGFVVLRSGGVI